MRGGLFSILSDLTLAKLDRIILFCVFGSIPFGLLIFFVYSSLFGPSSEQVTKKYYLQLSCKGRVNSIFNDIPNHNLRYAILNTGYQYPIPDPSQVKIEVGDSLSKKEGEHILHIYKKGSKEVDFDYQIFYEK